MPSAAAERARVADTTVTPVDPDLPFALFQHRGTRAIQRMVEYAPSTGGLALWVRHEDVLADDAQRLEPGSASKAPVPPVTTDGYTIRYSAAFEALPLSEQVGWVAHEVLHIALRHPQRFLDLQHRLGDADLQLFNLCADAIVNSTLDHLSWLQLPDKAVTIDQLLSAEVGMQKNVEAALLEWDVERLYRAIDDRRPQDRGGKRDGPRAASVRALGRADQADLKPGSDAREAPEEGAAQAREWSERIARAHANDGEFSMLRTLIADLPSTHTPWEQVLRTQLARSLAPKRDISWSRPSRSYLANQGRAASNRRMPWEPGFSSSKASPRLVVIVDVSGSIDDTLMQRFACEVEAIVRRLEAGLVLVIGDEQVHEVMRFEPARAVRGRSGLRDIVFQGGGGTDFTPLLEEADGHRPDIGVVLTDLDGPAYFRPRWPVIWAVPEAHASALAPFGRKLVLR
jgi:predicted metal-dependent peptidase